MQTELPSHRSPYPEEIVELVRWLTASRGLRPILAPMCLSYPRRIQRTSLPGLHKARRCFVQPYWFGGTQEASVWGGVVQPYWFGDTQEVGGWV